VAPEISFQEELDMPKLKRDELLSCEVCGLILTVVEPCGCADVSILCCKKPMGKGKLAANKARKLAAQKNKPAKPAAKKTTAEKAVAKAKPAAKKGAATKTATQKASAKTSKKKK
jgi:hypothetical protein